ncbi:MAG: hypothetical protein HFK02_01915 [Clostridia bacterium]|jgi:hypothetical protein|nr:hypothetical protein [Clostridia bacterium]
MEQKKNDSEILAEIYRNAQIALTSISDIMPEVEDGGIREEIMREHEEYEKVCSEAAHLALKYDVELKEPNPVKKAMMWSAIKMGAANDNSSQNIAQMLIRGTVNGITSLKTTMTDGGKNIDPEVKKLLSSLISLEEGFEKKLKKFL